jgi:hypothetical protein
LSKNSSKPWPVCSLRRIFFCASWVVLQQGDPWISVEVSGIAWYSYSYGKIQLFAQKAATMLKLYRYRCSGSNFWCFTTNGKVAKV